VWVVEANLKKGTRHIYHKRVFHLDEDSWTISVVDNYDSRLEIWRPQEAHLINYYDQPLVAPTMEGVYDIQNGRYVTYGMTNEGDQWSFNEKYSAEMFKPANLRRVGR
jgi:phage pi2 protein 07